MNAAHSKRITAAIRTLALALSLAACSGEVADPHGVEVIDVEAEALASLPAGDDYVIDLTAPGTVYALDLSGPTERVRLSLTDGRELAFDDWRAEQPASLRAVAAERAGRLRLAGDPRDLMSREDDGIGNREQALVRGGGGGSGGLGYLSCNLFMCECTGDRDCNDMFEHFCGGDGVCDDSSPTPRCWCWRWGPHRTTTRRGATHAAAATSVRR